MPARIVRLTDRSSVAACSKGIPAASALLRTCAATSSVITQPGQMLLAVIGVSAVSRAVTLVSPSIPCFAATYADLYGLATFPCTDAMLIILPQFCLRMCGSASRVVWKAAVRLTAATLCVRQRVVVAGSRDRRLH